MRPLRTLAGLAAVAISVAACGSPGGDAAAQNVASPQFVDPAVVAGQSSLPATAQPTLAQPTPTRPTPTQPNPAGGPTSAGPAPDGPSAPPAKPQPTKPKVKYVFPVKASNVAFHPTHSKYPATDIFADCGEPAVATTSGVVLEVSLKDVYVEGSPDGPNNGGLSVSLLGDDGVRYYGSHLSKVLDGIRAGARVSAGQQLGKVGHTGNASGVCHLHYGISPPCAKVGDWKVRRGVVWPYTFLASWRKGGQKNPGPAMRAWRNKHHCKA
jgi:murein DD-endopeptidase MepM/ murein hydrolase activator NlpD